jgi:hypothetical protein
MAVPYHQGLATIRTAGGLTVVDGMLRLPKLFHALEIC